MSELRQREEAGACGCGLHSHLHAVEVVLERLVGLGAELRVVDRRDEAAPVDLQSEEREERGRLRDQGLWRRGVRSGAPVDLLGGAGAVARERVLVSVRRGEEHLKRVVERGGW